MPLILTSGSQCEPITLDEAKAHCRVDGDAEDTLISSLILAARLHVEQALSLALIQQRWSLFLDAWPAKAWVELPLAPLVSIDAVRLYSPSGTSVTLEPTLFFADTASRRPRLVRTGTQSWPLPGRSANGIEIAFTTGYGTTPDDVPAPLKQAIKLLIAHWYEGREPVRYDDDANLVPLTVASLMQPYIAVKL